MISHLFDMEFTAGSLKGLSIPERSPLFALAPVESPPAQRESLISLLVRTSGAHSLNPRRLIAGVLAKTNPRIATLIYPSFFNRLSGTINGHGKYANLFVQAVEHLTGQPGMSRLTLLPWKDLFPHNGQGMLSRHPRWCSTCLLEQRRSREDVYFPLLWSLEAYRHCSIHDQQLDDRCPHCGKRQPFLPRYPDQAVCHHCLRSLITMPAVATVDEEAAVGEFNTWVATVLGNMVARHGDPDFAPSVGHFHVAVKSVVDTTAGGNRAALCRAIGFNESALKNWLTKGERPSLTHFLAFSYAVQVPPVDLVTGNVDSHVLETSMVRRPEKLKVRKTCQKAVSDARPKVLGWLHEALRAEQAQPVSAIAKRWGVTTQYLRYWFPDDCRKLTVLYKKSIRLKSAERLRIQVQRVQEIVCECRRNNRYPSRRKVDTALRIEGASLGKRMLFDAYRAALEA